MRDLQNVIPPRTKHRAVFLDRDGVLNRAIVRDGKPYPPGSIEAFEILPDVFEACRRLHQAGFLLIVVTNQPDVARKLQRRETIEDFHRILLARLPLDDIRVCFHDNGDRCACRKPAPGLLLDAARDFEVELHSSFLVGDRASDIKAGHLAECHTIFLDRGYAEAKPPAPGFTCSSLAEAAEYILAFNLNEI